MKHLKIYEGYLSDKMKVIKDKFNKLKKVVDFIEKYDFESFVIAMEHNDIQFEYIEKDSNGDYFLEYVDYNISKKTIKKYLVDLPDDVLDSLIECCEQYGRLEIENHLEIGLNINTFINILKKHKESIKFNTYMFSILVESSLQDKVNTFKFQNILFSTHPEAFTSFMDECIDQQERSKIHKFEPLRIAPGMQTGWLKYSDLD